MPRNTHHPQQNEDTKRPSLWGKWRSWFLALLIAGAVIVAALHWGDVEKFADLTAKAQPLWLAGALLLQVSNRTLPPLLYYLSAFGFPGLASAVAVVMLVPALVIVILLEPAFRSGLFAGGSR